MDERSLVRSKPSPSRRLEPAEELLAVASVLQVGDVEIDTRRFEVRHGARRLTVEPRVFDFMVYLALHRDRVVSKRELVEVVWSGNAVTDCALARCASLARKALGDPGVIVSVPRRGYRWGGDWKISSQS
jgi:DNA-binding winged helix-turn-helix (wHTH) protein